MGAHITSDKDGNNIFISNSGVEYSMYEGMTMGIEPKTSDIVFFVLDAYDFAPAELAFWAYGANVIDDYMIERIATRIDKYESEHKEIIDNILNGTYKRLS